jgi:hypothetical protein
MWESWTFTNLWASTACYSFTYYIYKKESWNALRVTVVYHHYINPVYNNLIYLCCSRCMHFHPRQCTRYICGTDLEPTSVACTTCRIAIHSALQRLFCHLSVPVWTIAYYLVAWIKLIFVHVFQSLVLKILIIRKFRKCNVVKSSLTLSSCLSYLLTTFLLTFCLCFFFFYYFFVDGSLGSIILEALVYFHCRSLLSLFISRKIYMDKCYWNRFCSKYFCFLCNFSFNLCSKCLCHYAWGVIDLVNRHSVYTSVLGRGFASHPALCCSQSNISPILVTFASHVTAGHVVRFRDARNIEECRYWCWTSDKFAMWKIGKDMGV